MTTPLASAGATYSSKDAFISSVQSERLLLSGKDSWLLGLFGAILLHLVALAIIFWSATVEPKGQATAEGAGGVMISLGAISRASSDLDAHHDDGAADVINVSEPTTLPDTPSEPTSELTAQPQFEQAADQVKNTELLDKTLTAVQAKPEIPSEATTEAAVSQLAPVTQEKAENKNGIANQSSLSQGSTDSSDNSAGGGLPGAVDDYTLTLLAWLEQHKDYPRQARLRRLQGTVLLYFKLGQDGQLLSYRIEQTSGHTVLDEEVLKMIIRAQPLPVPPNALRATTLELIVPVQFYLR